MFFISAIIAVTHFKEHVSIIFHANNATQFNDHVHLFMVALCFFLYHIHFHRSFLDWTSNS